MERLSGLDSAFLSFETPAMHLHVAIAAVIDPDTMAGEYSFEQPKDFVSGRLLAAAALRRRVVEGAVPAQPPDLGRGPLPRPRLPRPPPRTPQAPGGAWS